MKIISELIQMASQKRNALQAEVGRCGVCKQNNTVTTFTSSAPQVQRTDIICKTAFVRNFPVDLHNAEIEVFVSDTLRGRNVQGQQLLSDCNDSCSLYTASAQTPIEAGTSHLNMSVLCGPLRQGSILSSPYVYRLGFVHQWTCSK